MQSLKFVRLASLLALAFSLCATAQTQVTLTSPASPATGQAGITTINVTGSNYPSGTITQASTTVSLQPTGGGTITTTTPSAVTTIVGSTRRVTFAIPSSIVIASPTAYKITIAGQTTTAVQFASSNSAALTINPPPTITQVNPNTGGVGQTLSVTITGQFTTFTQGSTQARFGPNISVGGAAAGVFGPVTVTSSTTATASVSISGSAPLGPVNVDVNTGQQQATLANGFTIGPPNLTSNREYIFFNGRIVAIEQH